MGILTLQRGLVTASALLLMFSCSVAKASESTASDNVTVLSDAVSFRELPRPLRVYLPPDYTESSKRYPVLYMHDGQNVFDDRTAYAGEWGIDEILDQMHSEGTPVPIVVAVDHGGEMRMRELGPWTHPEFGESIGSEYADFMVNTVKPYIDQHYRTHADADHTAIMGSSMGGLMSHYLIAKHPGVYSKAGVFSPSFWFSEKAFQLVENAPLPKQHRVYFVVGTGEGKGMVEPAQAMFYLHSSQQHPTDNLFINVVPDGQHNEGFWHQHALNAIKWLFNETIYEETE